MHIESDEFVHDYTEVTLLFVHLPQAIRSINYPFYITYILSYVVLPRPLAQRNHEIDQLLTENVLEASKFS